MGKPLSGYPSDGKRRLLEMCKVLDAEIQLLGYQVREFPELRERISKIHASLTKIRKRLDG